MKTGRGRPASVRAILLLMAACLGLVVAAVGAYVTLELAPAATALRAGAGTLAEEYDSLRVRAAALQRVLDAARRLNAGPSLRSDVRQRVRALTPAVAAIAAQSAGVQASLVLSGIPAAMRVSLGDAAGLESRVAGMLLEALGDLDVGDHASVASWIRRAEAASDMMAGRLGDAQRVGLVDLAERERVLGERATRVGIAVAVWLVLGALLVGLSILVFHRRLYVPLALLERGLTRVAQGDLEASLPVGREDELGRLMAHFNEMTEVLRARPEVEALRRSEVRFRSLIEHGMDLISIIGADGRFLYASPAVTRLLGFGTTELIGQVGFDYLHPDDREHVQAAFVRALGGAANETREEFRFRHKDGSWRYFESVVTNLVGEPTVAGLVINSRDVTERRQAEDALQRSEERFRGVYEDTTIGLYRTTPDGRILMANPALIKMLGYGTFEALASRNLEAGGYEPDYPRADFRRRLESAGEVVGLESAWKRADGSTVWVRESARMVRGSDGQPQYYDGTVEDITERRKAEETLRAEEFLMGTLMDSLPDSIYFKDAKSRFIRVNQAFAHWCRLKDPAQVVGQTDFDIFAREHAEAALAVEREIMRTGQPVVNLEEEEIWPDRPSTWVSTTKMALRDPAGAIIGTFGISRDITARKRAEELLRRSEADYRDLIEHAPLGIYRSTREGRFLTVNSALVAMLGYGTAEELARLDIARDVYADPEARESLVAQFGQRDEAKSQTEWKRKDGALVAVKLNVRVVRDSAGAAEYYEGLVEDVTEQRSLENQFRQAQRMEAVGRLAGGVAHDFNNVLTAISGYTELLLADLDTQSPLRQDVEEIRTAAKRAADLTRQLLAFSRKQVLQSRVLDLNTVVRALEKMLQRLIGEDVTLDVALDPVLGAVRADPGQIEQVILNLAVNSRDAMPDGGRLTIETTNVTLDETYSREHAGASPGRYVMLAVSDTGVGIDAETLSHIFEPFFTTKEQGKGTGLGLATVYGIVKQSGGYVWVYSEPGRGATFKIYLPQVDEPVEEHDRAPPRESAAGGRETVLLAEDDPSVRDVVTEVLTQKGYRVLRAPDGQTALEMARAQPGEIQLLITDMVMPGMTGRELAEALAGERTGVRVLYMSGYTDDAVIRHGVLAEGMPYLQKPFTPQALALKVREILDRS
jgi:PAS domain S-box-containing protein